MQGWSGTIRRGGREYQEVWEPENELKLYPLKRSGFI